MRFTIERIRTLVLVAGVLLLAALTVLLVTAKWKNLLNRRDLPQRLGLNIRQEANGYTFVHTFGAHSQYRIHASKEVQLKNDRIELHDVQIELYGPDGASMDRIAGDEFEYDQESGVATAQGPVEMLLTRPQERRGSEPRGKDHPAATASASEQIKVKTSGVSFDQNSGLVTTAQRVDFSMTQGSGSAMGARYDSQSGYLTLEQAVELTTHRGAASVEIHARHAEFDRGTMLCLLRGATAAYRGGQADAAQVKILFRKDGSAQSLDATDGFAMQNATGGRLAAPTARMDFDEHNQPRHGHLEGGVTMDSVRAGGTAHGSSPTAELEFTAQGQLRHAHLERGVVMQSQETSQEDIGQAGLHVSRTWRSPVANVDFRDTGKGQVEPASMRGTGGVVLTSETRRGDGAAVPSRMTADEVTGAFGPGPVLKTMTGVGHAEVEQTTATGARQTASSDRLQARFTAVGEATASNTAKATGGHGEAGAAGNVTVQAAELDGHVALFEQPAAKRGAQPQPPIRATAGKAVYEDTGQWLHLTIAPRVENGGLVLTAERVDVSQQSGDAFARGNVKATWTDLGTASAGPQNAAAISNEGLGATTLGGKEPAHVIAAEAQLNVSTGEVTFCGHARLWQQANSVSGPVIVLNQHMQTLVARSADPAEPVRAVLLSAGEPAAGMETGQPRNQNGGANVAGKPAAPSVIRVRSGELWYSDAEHRAVMHGGALGTVVAETGTATSSSDVIELRLMPAENHGGGNGGQAQVDRMTATGHVVLASQGRRGTGAQLAYSSVTGEYVLTGTAAAPPKLADPARGTVTGETLIFHSRDDSVSIEGGGRETKAETTAPEAHGK